MLNSAYIDAEEPIEDEEIIVIFKGRCRGLTELKGLRMSQEKHIGQLVN